MPHSLFPNQALHTCDSYFTALKSLPATYLEEKENRDQMLRDIPTLLDMITDHRQVKQNLLVVIGLDGFKSHRNFLSLCWSFFFPSRAQTWTEAVNKGIKIYLNKLHAALPPTNGDSTAQGSPELWHIKELLQFLVDIKKNDELVETTAITEDITRYLNRISLEDAIGILEDKKELSPELTKATSVYLQVKIAKTDSLDELKALRRAWHKHNQNLISAGKDLLGNDELIKIETYFYQRTIALILSKKDIDEQKHDNSIDGDASALPAISSATTSASTNNQGKVTKESFDLNFHHWFPDATVKQIPNIKSVTAPEVKGQNIACRIENAMGHNHENAILRSCHWVKNTFTKAINNANFRWGVFVDNKFDGQELTSVNFKQAQFSNCSFKACKIRMSQLPLLYIDQMHVDKDTSIDAKTLINILSETEIILKKGIYANVTRTLKTGEGRNFADEGFVAVLHRNLNGKPIKGQNMVRQFTRQQIELAFAKLLPAMPLATEAEYLQLLRALEDLPNKFPGYDLPFTEKRAWHKTVANLQWSLVAHAREQLGKTQLESPETSLETIKSSHSTKKSLVATPVVAVNEYYNPPLTYQQRSDWRHDFDNNFRPENNPNGHKMVQKTLIPILEVVLKNPHSRLREHRHWWPHFSEPHTHQELSKLVATPRRNTI